MAFRLPRRLQRDHKRLFGDRGTLLALASLGALLATSAQAQVIIGGHKGPAVSVDDSVLERLGPPLTLPQRFLGERDPGAVKRQVVSHHPTTHSAAASHRSGKRIAKRAKHPTRHKIVVAKAARFHSVKAPVKMASSLHQIIHLIPPKSRVASATPTPIPAIEIHKEISHQAAAISAPTRRAEVALTAAASAPEPVSNDVPTPAVEPPQEARDEVPSTSATPPSQPALAAPSPAAAASSPTAATASDVPLAKPTAASTRPPSPVASPLVPSMTIAVAASAPGATVAAAPPATVTPAVQIAAATTVGNAGTAVKFKPGVTDLGSGAQPVLDAIANRLLANENLRVQLVSHATGGVDDAMEARRVSLARAIAVRAYLIDKGVRSLRIDVRALGNRAENGPAADQVDLLVVSQ